MKKTHPIAVRLDEDIKDLLDKKAEEEERSLAWLINRALREHFGMERPSARRAKR